MIEKLQAKKKLIAGVAAGVLVIGGAGYYYYAQQQSSGAEHAGHQTTTPVMAMGDVVTLDAKARQLSGLQTAQVASKALTKAIKTTGKIALNDSGRTYITSRVEGRIDELYVVVFNL